MQEDKPQTNPLALSTGFVNVDGGQLYYEVAGKGHPLVLFQGTNLLDQRIWDHQFTTFAHSHRVVRYDVRGFGKSPNSTGPYTHADDLAHLFQALKIEKSYLLDLGGSSLLDFVHKYAPSVDALILASPEISSAQSSAQAIDELPRVLERYASMVEALRQNDMQRAIDEVMRMLSLSSSPSLETYQHVRTIVADNLPALLNPPLPPTVDIKAFDTRHQWLKEMQIPTLLLVGEHARSEVQASVQALGEIIPGSQSYTIAQAHFLLNVEQPEEFNRTVLSFLQALP